MMKEAMVAKIMMMVPGIVAKEMAHQELMGLVEKGAMAQLCSMN